MKKILTSVCCILFACCVSAQQMASLPAIIPAPVSMSPATGSFVFSQQVAIAAEGTQDITPLIQLLSDRLEKNTGLHFAASKDVSQAAVLLSVLPSWNKAQGGVEGYKLSVTPKQIHITAGGNAGLFYGLQTVLQLLPNESETSNNTPQHKWEIPCVEITDYPRFAWRGLMFDVARHFFTVAEVKKFMDEMARYKLNVLHLHLADDEGWRVEIKGFPKLTEVGAWNVKKVGYFGTFNAPDSGEPRNFGGFYTQDDIRDLVKYGKERFINILPELDMPGHSLAAIASYPELSCTPGADKYRVRSGEEIMDWSHGAPPVALIDNTLCPANPRVYSFLDTVIGQIAQLFPFEYIHLGGDECPKNFWQQSPAIQALAKKEKLKNMEEVQSYFEKKVEKIVESKGKKFMGWDEILEGGLAPNAVVMSWRGMKGGVQAAKMGHDVVMSPTTYAYLDYMQADPIIEPKVYSSLHLSKSYEFEPVPDGVDPKYIKGGQANLWTEQVYTMRTVEYMVWPRGWAIAESVWSPKEKKNWPDFFARAEQHFRRFDSAEIKYSRAAYDPIFTITSGADSTLSVKLTSEAPGLDIYYSFDNSFPDRFYPKYSSPLVPPKEAAMLRVITYKGREKVGRMLTMPISEMKKRAASKTNYP